MTNTPASQTALFDVLDAYGFQFRQSFQSLIAQNTLPDTPLWRPESRFASLGQTRDFIDGLDRPMHFRFSDDHIHSENFPRRIEGAVRQSGDEHENYSSAVEQLTQLFGEGHETTTANYRSCVWAFGTATVTASIFPRELNKPKPHNDRHRLDPASVTECGLIIQTGYYPEPNNAELAAINELKVLKPGFSHPEPQVGPNDSEYSRRLSDKSLLPDGGFGFGPIRNLGAGYSEQYFVVRSGSEYFEIIPRNRLRGLKYDQHVPDRGRGHVRVAVLYTCSNGRMGDVTLRKADYKRDRLRNFAIALSQAMTLEYRETQTPFCDSPPNE